MKRHPALLQLSREHYGALKLARDARSAAGSSDTELLGLTAQRVVGQFVAELDPHFRFEEQNILPQLIAAGEHDLAQRTLTEHEELRRLAKSLSHPEASDLQRFGELLAAHVRFEERELFETVQRKCLLSTNAEQ